MLATVYDVEARTGYITDVDAIAQAQAIVEVVAGRTEDAIGYEADKLWMNYAICWQVAYMATDRTSVYEQANVASLRQDNYSVTFGDRTYAVAPLALEAVELLSWKRSRSVATGPIFDAVPLDTWETC